MKKLISVLLILAAFASCKKDDNKECQTKVLLREFFCPHVHKRLRSDCHDGLLYITRENK